MASTTVARLEAVLSADTKRFDDDVDRSERRFSKFGSAIKVGALAAGAAIGAGLAVAAKVGFDEFIQGQKVAAQTGAVLKSTGGIANVTAKQIDTLAGSLMRKSGVDDEAIKSGSNMLLTFTKIRNEVGAGNDIFNQATQTTLDLSVAMGKDMQSSAILVGKALNDPIKGVTALTKAGVQLSEGQKETIKSMVEAGNVMGAQKIILGELETQFGGSAEAAGKTFGGQMNILKETFSNTAGEIVGRFVPALVEVAQFAGPLILAALDGIGKLIDLFVAPTVRRLADTFSEAGPRILGVVQSVFGWIQEHVFPIIRALRDIWVNAVTRIREVLVENEPELKRIFERVGAAMDDLSKVIIPLLKFAFTVVLPEAINVSIKAVDALSDIMERINSVKGPSLLDIMDKLGLKSEWVGDKLLGKGGWNQGLIAIINKDEGLLEMLGIWQKIADWINRAWKHLKDFSDKLNDIKGPSLLDVIKGDPAALDVAQAMPSGSVDTRLWSAMGLGRTMGLNMVSGYRPGATVRGSGVKSDHSYFPSKAIDEAGSASAMSRFARAVTALAGIDTVIYSPLGIWKAGSGWGAIRSAATRADHYDHVHVDTFDRGGWLKPGLTLAMNNTGRPERVGGGNTYITIQAPLGYARDMGRWLREVIRDAGTDGIVIDQPKPGF